MKFKAVILSAIVFVASYIILLYTFFNAYLSPIKTVIIDINGIGEANIELIFLLASIPCVAYFLKNLRWSSHEKMLWVKVDE